MVGHLRPHPHAQAVKLRDALSRRRHLPGARAAAAAARAQLGLPANKVPRLHGIAQAALEGKLDREPLLAADPDDAFTQLLELPGIGPFYAGLILLRAVGTTDVAPKGEPKLEKAVQERYGEPLESVAERLAAVPDLGLRPDAGERMTERSTSSATSRPASRRCT